jgi:hypothetical protein
VQQRKRSRAPALCVSQSPREKKRCSSETSVWSLEFRVQSSEFRVQSPEFRVRGTLRSSGLRAQGAEYRKRSESGAESLEPRSERHGSRPSDDDDYYGGDDNCSASGGGGGDEYDSQSVSSATAIGMRLWLAGWLAGAKGRTNDDTRIIITMRATDAHRGRTLEWVELWFFFLDQCYSRWRLAFFYLFSFLKANGKGIGSRLECGRCLKLLLFTLFSFFFFFSLIFSVALDLCSTGIRGSKG